jgi:short-subunit dehydrogenase
LQNPETILITGASSGIGEALARHYAKAGVTLVLTGRNQERLSRVETACREQGATVVAKAIDVADQLAMADWIAEIDSRSPLDLVIANAGISGGASGGLDNATREIFRINVEGTFNTVHPALTVMRARQRGQIALVSSLAGYIGMPGAPGYGASKAAVRSYGEALRGRYAAAGIEVSVISPGFVVSGITDKNKFPMPFLMTADKAAGIIARGLARNKSRIAFPWPMYAAIRLAAMLPVFVTEKLFGRLPKKT